jgi:hypothetical protein
VRMPEPGPVSADAEPARLWAHGEEEQMTTPSDAPPAVEVVVGYFNRILAADNGLLSFIRREGDTVVLRYREGKNDNCPTCVLTPEDLTELIREATQKRDAFIASVTLI